MSLVIPSFRCWKGKWQAWEPYPRNSSRVQESLTNLGSSKLFSFCRCHPGHPFIRWIPLILIVWSTKPLLPSRPCRSLTPGDWHLFLLLSNLLHLAESCMHHLPFICTLLTLWHHCDYKCNLPYQTWSCSMTWKANRSFQAMRFHC